MTAGTSATDPLPVPESSVPARARRLRRLPDETGVLVALIALVLIVGVLRPELLPAGDPLPAAFGAAFIGMLALGMVFVVVIRDIDLSVGWMFNFSAVIAAKAMVAGVDPCDRGGHRHRLRRRARPDQRRPRGLRCASR